MTDENEKEVFDTRSVGKTVIESEYESELDERSWSVISFDKREAAGLTYEQASEFMAELDLQRVAGLCIVTDEAAERVNA